jgi:hypothetical protein
MHWAFASISLPAVYWLVRRDVRSHGRTWVLWVAVVGIAGVLIGLIAPAIGWGQHLAIVVDAPGWLESLASTDSASAATGCTDECCASLSQGEGGAQFRLPFASIVTMAGGVLLVASHAANLCAKGRCSRGSCSC